MGHSYFPCRGLKWFPKMMNSKVTLIPFGFKYGNPRANYIFDVSFLVNPVRQPGRSLRDPLDDNMRQFVLNQKEALAIIEVVANLIDLLINIADDIRIGIGCNSGRHRSRIICEEILRRNEHANIQIKLE